MDSATPRAQASTLPSYAGTPAGSERSDALYADVAARLRTVCAAMPSEAFDRLVSDICAMKRRWKPDRSPAP